jgi:geranylgeranyl diphosphate synthase type II
MRSLEELYALYEQRFSGENFRNGPEGLYLPVRHIMQSPGKKIRPLLLLASCELFGGDATAALDPAFAFEVFHNFTLVHDDIMDAAELRRGLPTVHRKFGLNAAILAGDAMLTFSYEYLSHIPDFALRSALKLFNRTAMEIFEGQQMDVDFEQRTDVNEEEYLKMISYKTSVLLGAAVQTGAMIASADHTQQELIYSFGLNMGISFQIKDDLLDAFGQGDKVGKVSGGDILQNKKTWLLITALEKAGDAQRAEIRTLLEEKNPEYKVSRMKEIMQELRIPFLAEARIDELYQQAMQSLEEIQVPEGNKLVMRQLAARIHGRDR